MVFHDSDILGLRLCEVLLNTKDHAMAGSRGHDDFRESMIAETGDNLLYKTLCRLVHKA